MDVGDRVPAFLVHQWIIRCLIDVVANNRRLLERRVVNIERSKSWSNWIAANRRATAGNRDWLVPLTSGIGAGRQHDRAEIAIGLPDRGHNRSLLRGSADVRICVR